MYKTIFLLLALFVFAASQASASCIGSKSIPMTADTNETCAQAFANKKRAADIARREQAEELKQREGALPPRINGDQNANSGTIQNFNLGVGGASGFGSADPDSGLLDAEAQLELFISSAIFELSPQQPGAKRQFLTSQNSGGTAIGARYKFSKGVHLVGKYEKFRYKGKEFDDPPNTSGQVQVRDGFGNPTYDPTTGQPVMEEVTLHDNSYRWADGYEHTRYMVGAGFRGTFDEQSRYSWTLDVYPIGWFTTNYMHTYQQNIEETANKAYGFSFSINYHMSKDFTVSGYYQLFDAQKEASRYASEFRPLGSQELGITANFGLPNALGVIY